METLFSQEISHCYLLCNTFRIHLLLKIYKKELINWDFYTVRQTKVEAELVTIANV